MKKSKKQLSDDDRRLWEQVRKTTTPLRENPILSISEVQKKPSPKPNKSIESFEAPSFKFGEKANKNKPKHNLASGLSTSLAQEPLLMDQRKFGKMQRGKLVPEAKIDLHGLTLAEAHPELVRFVLGSWARGLRLVLVITGKGKHRDQGGPIPVRTGVLKHQVPQWLKMPPLKDAILQVTEAHLKHGGTGAYYVYLRRRR